MSRSAFANSAVFPILFLVGACTIATLDARAVPDATPAVSRTDADLPPIALAVAPDQWLHHDDVSIRYREIGRGEPVILLHGYTDRVEMWDGPADTLARRYRVIVPDIRGFGQSTKSGDAEFFGRHMVTDVIALLDSLGVRKAHLVGYSMGGLIAANVALEFPRRVRSVTLVAPAIWNDQAVATREFAPYVQALEEGRGLDAFFRFIVPTMPDSTLRAASAHYYLTNDPASLVASLRSLPLLTIDSARMSRAKVPAVVVVSQVDPLLPHARRVVRWWPRATGLVLRSHDHSDVFLSRDVLAAFREVAGRDR